MNKLEDLIRFDPEELDKACELLDWFNNEHETYDEFYPGEEDK